MTTPRIISTTAVLAAFAVTGVAGAAEAPVVSDQEYIVGGAPVTIAGTGVQKGEWMGAKAKLVYRDVTLSPGQKVTITLRADNGRKVRGLAVAEGQRMPFAVVGKGNYAGRRQVRVRVMADRRAEGRQTGRFYALTK